MTSRAKRCTAAAHVALVTLAVEACGGREELDCASMLAARVPHAVRYVLAWDGPLDTPIVSDRGYLVRVTDGALVDYATQLVPCEPEELAALATPICGGELPAWVPSGHGTSEVDDSRVAGALVEPLLGTSFDFGHAVAFPRLYCRAHYLTGPATATTVGGADGTTLQVDGWFAREPGSPETPFHFETGAAWGAFFALEEGDGATLVDAGARSVVVTLTRPRTRMFDGIDFAAVSPSDGGRAALRNLVVGTRAAVATE